MYWSEILMENAFMIDQRYLGIHTNSMINLREKTPKFQKNTQFALSFFTDISGLFQHAVSGGDLPKCYSKPHI